MAEDLGAEGLLHALQARTINRAKWTLQRAQTAEKGFYDLLL